MVAPVPLEQAFVSYLTPLGVPVGTRIPATRPASFVRVLRVGGDRLNLAQTRPRMVFECWGSTDSQAWSLARSAWALVNGSVELDDIGLGVEVMEADLDEIVNFPDVATGSPRYQFSADLTTNLKE